MSVTAPQLPCIHADATRVFSADFTDMLDSGELLTGAPTVLEQTTTDLTLANKAVNTAVLMILGRTVAIGAAVQFSCSGQNSGTDYSIKISIGTDATPAQTLVGFVEFQGVSS